MSFGIKLSSMAPPPAEIFGDAGTVAEVEADSWLARIEGRLTVWSANVNDALRFDTMAEATEFWAGTALAPTVEVVELAEQETPTAPYGAE